MKPSHQQKKNNKTTLPQPTNEKTYTRKCPSTPSLYSNPLYPQTFWDQPCLTTVSTVFEGLVQPALDIWSHYLLISLEFCSVCSFMPFSPLSPLKKKKKNRLDMITSKPHTETTALKKRRKKSKKLCFCSSCTWHNSIEIFCACTSMQ